MRRAPRTVACAMACASLAAGVVFADAFRAVIAPFELEPEQLAYAAKLGCRDPHGLGLHHASGFSWSEVDHDDMWVSGECVSHRAIAGYPVRYSIDCRHQKGEWACYEDREKLYAEVDGKRVQVQTAAADVSLEEAFGIVGFLESIDAWQPHIPDPLNEAAPPYEYFEARSRNGDVVTLYVQKSGDREVKVIHSGASVTYQVIR